MRKITKEYNLYKFEELDKNVQESILERYIESEIEFYCDCCLKDVLGEKASDLLNDYFGITSDYLDTYYDLSYCQGSGAMIEFDINIKDLNNKYKIFSDNEIELLNNKYVVSDIRIRHNNNFYCHEYTFGIDCDFYMGLEYDDIKEDYKITENEFNTIENRLYDLLDDSNKHYTKSPFIKDVINVNKELSNCGYSVLEDKEYFKEMALETLNDLEFLESGEEFYV
jgi:hypothetical protein